MSHPYCGKGIGKTEELVFQGFLSAIKKVTESRRAELHFQKAVISEIKYKIFSGLLFILMSNLSMLVNVSGAVKYKCGFKRAYAASKI